MPHILLAKPMCVLHEIDNEAGDIQKLPKLLDLVHKLIEETSFFEFPRIQSEQVTNPAIK